MDAIEGNEKPKSRTETQGFAIKHEDFTTKPNKKQGSHDFFADLEENFEDNAEDFSQKPAKVAKPSQTFAKTAQNFGKTPVVTPPHEEIKSRRANLFGLSKEMSARGSENNSNNQSFSRNPERNNENLAIGTVEIGGVSRRKNQKTLSSHTTVKENSRPFTSPGVVTQGNAGGGDFFENLRNEENLNKKMKEL